MYVFFTIFILVVVSIYSYVGWRLIRPAHLSRLGKRLAWSALYGSFAVFLTMVLLRVRGVEAVWGDIVAWVAFLTLGAVLLLATLLAIRDLVGLAALGVRGLMRWRRRMMARQASDGNVMDPGRRRFLVQSSNLGILVLGGGLTGYGLYEARRRPDVVRVDVEAPERVLANEGDLLICARSGSRALVGKLPAFPLAWL